MDSDTRYIARLLRDAATRERTTPPADRACWIGWNDSGRYLRSRDPLAIRPTCEVWDLDGRTRDVAHGAAILPPASWSHDLRMDALERVASGYCEDTVAVSNPRMDALLDNLPRDPEIRTVASFASDTRESRRVAEVAASPEAPEVVRYGMSHGIDLASGDA